MDQQKMSTAQTVLVGIICFAVGFAVSYGIWGRNQSVGDQTRAPGGETQTPGESGGEMQKTIQSAGAALVTTVAGTNAISVEDQPPGNRVAVASASLSVSAWIAIHEDQAGKPGRILGARRLDPGTWSNAEVELLRAAQPGQTYYAMLHREDGDRQFDQAKDLPIADAAGNPITASFRTTATQ